MNEELKKAASPYTKLEKTITGQHADIVKELRVHSVMLDRLCSLKEAQLESDVSFRESWQHGKKKDLYLSLVFLALAGSALYLDIIKFNPEGVILTTLFKLIGL